MPNKLRLSWVQLDSDVIMSTLPTFHAFGFAITTLMPLSEGIPIVCHADPKDVATIASGIKKYSGTILSWNSYFSENVHN